MVNSNMEIVHDGWLLKSPPPKRLWRAKWRNRWFVLRSGELPGQYFLEYYTDDTLKKLKGKIDLDQCEQVDAGITFAQRKFDYKFMFDIKTPKRVYYLCTETEEQMNRWVDCVCQVCGLKVMAPEDQYDPLAQLNSSGNLGSQALNPNVAFDNHNRLPDFSSVESPPPSATSIISGPYIPISECITGKKNTIGNTRFPFTSEFETHEDQRSAVPTQMAPSAPISYHNSNRGVKPRESYDMPRALRPSATSDESSTIQSPLSSESPATFSDEVQNHTIREEKTLSEAAQKTVIKQTDGESPPPYQAPPRPPKPPHLAEVVQQNYMNLETIMKATNIRRNSSGEKSRNGGPHLIVPESTSISSSDPEVSPNTPKEVSDDMYDFPRSHVADNVMGNATVERIRRHCYNNAAPGQAPGKVFSYDKESNDKTECDSRTSPLGNYANFASAPPAVNRGAKPKVSSDSNSLSAAELSPPPSSATPIDTSMLGAVGGMPIPPASAPPIVDRNRRKPPKKVSEPSLPLNSGDFVLDPVPQSRLRVESMESKKVRAAPSPTPPSLRNGRTNESDTDVDSHSSPGSRRDSTTDEQVFFPLHMVQRRPSHNEIQYLDLDLDPLTPLNVPLGSPKLLKNAGGTKSVAPSDSSIVYKKVDFVKTEAFNKMRQLVDEGYRKYQE